MLDWFQLFQAVSNFSVIILCLFLLLLVNYTLKWLPSKNFLSAFFILNITINSSLFMVDIFQNQLSFKLYIMTFPLILLLGPLLTRFTRATLRMEKLTIFDTRMKVLLASGYLLISPYLFMTNGSSIEEQPLNFQYLLLTSQLAVVLLFVINSCWHFLPILWHLSKGRLYSVGYGENTYHWLKGVWLSISLVWLTLIVDVISDLFDHHPVWRDVLSHLIGFLMFFLLALYSLRYCKQPEQADEIKHCQENSKYEKSALTAEHAEEILAKVDLLMTAEKLYLNHNISIDKIAALSQTQPQYLSQAINQYREMNFYEFIAFYRIEFAKQELENSPTKSIIDIAMSAGFNAKSTFNNTFKKMTGLTPSQYKKQQMPA